MIKLQNNQKVQLVSDSSATLDVFSSFYESNTGNGATINKILSSSTIDIIPAPGTGSSTVLLVNVRNTHATLPANILIQLTNGATTVTLAGSSLAPGESARYTPQEGFVISTSSGFPKVSQAIATPVTSAVITSMLSGDVVNNNAVANTMQDVTGLSFNVSANSTYWFEFNMPYTSAATTTGSRFSVSGPTFSLLSYRSRYPLSATTETISYGSTYDFPAAANASSLLTGNIAVVEGFIKPTSSGIVTARFASEILNSAITVKAGAFVRSMQVS